MEKTTASTMTIVAWDGFHNGPLRTHSLRNSQRLPSSTDPLTRWYFSGMVLIVVLVLIPVAEHDKKYYDDIGGGDDGDDGSDNSKYTLCSLSIFLAEKKRRRIND